MKILLFSMMYNNNFNSLVFLLFLFGANTATTWPLLSVAAATAASAATATTSSEVVNSKEEDADEETIATTSSSILSSETTKDLGINTNMRSGSNGSTRSTTSSNSGRALVEDSLSAPGPINSKIIGGSTVPPDENKYPFFVQLKGCGGALVAPDGTICFTEIETIHRTAFVSLSLKLLLLTSSPPLIVVFICIKWC